MPKSAKKQLPMAPVHYASAIKRSENKKAQSRLEAISCHCDATIIERHHDCNDDEGHRLAATLCVRGFLAGVLRKRLKLKLTSKVVDGERIYRVAGSPNADTSQSKRETR